MVEALHEHLELSLYLVETAPYRSLNITDVTYPHWILSYVQEGNVTTQSCGESWQARSGDVMLHPPHLPFSEFASSGGTHQWLQLNANTATHVDLFRLYPVAPVTTLAAHNNFSTIFSLLQTTWREPATSWRNLRSTALALQLCSIVIESWQRSGSIPRPAALLTPQDRFVDVIRHMSAHLGDKLTRDDLAALVHLHPGYFDRVFHNVYGTSPMQMLRDLRLSRARQLLETTDAPLPAIALTCGLGDAGYFNRVFRQRFGQTPGQYRQSAKNTMRSYIPAL